MRRLIPVLILLIAIILPLARLLTDYWWFSALGLSELFVTPLVAQLWIIIGTFVLVMGVLMGNFAIARTESPWRVKLIVSALIALFIGFVARTAWLDVLAYFNAQPFGISDPIFGMDVSFYVFTLPVLNLVWSLLFVTILISIVAVALDYLRGTLSELFRPSVEIVDGPKPTARKVFKRLQGRPLLHLTTLGAIAFILLAIRHYLARYTIMFSESGIVVGAGYTDVHVYLPVMFVLMLVASLIAVSIFFLARGKRRRYLALEIGVYLVLLLLAPTLVPGVIQSLVVSPNELNLEKPYIEHNIAFTRLAYGLENVTTLPFEPEPLTRDRLDAAPATIDNIRLLDWRPLTQTYKQTQEIRLYYDLSGIDVDRYALSEGTRQVMIAPRELDQEQIAENAKTWVNLHMVYTHGYGAVVSPVNEVTPEGLPAYLVKDIPPVASDPALEITEPRIYYGERDNQYVLVNTETEEFDYPEGSANQYTQYSGTGGVELSSFTRSFFMMLRFTDLKILLSGDVTDESRILFRRNIQERISTLAPFLSLDRDPYIVIHEGRLVWIQDAYTTTGRFPYSERSGRINYIRNSVKVVVDAYNGDVQFYVADEEPIIATYRAIFPDVFKPLREMPETLRAHLRYPQDLLEIQSGIYSIYHMENPTVFYNKEDAWEVPNEIYGTGQRIRMEPYYVIMDLPGDDRGAEFILMTPFTPIRKDNMISWLAARSDPGVYGSLLLYQFPKDQLVYGPSQVEAKIDQDSEISEQLTLWSQQGSRVTRGNLLVIPVENSILYVEPLYIQAETGQLPQLKRVIVSDGERVVMEETLGESLDALFGRSTRPSDPGIPGTLLAQAQQYYDDIDAAMRSGDWAGIGDGLDNLGRVLSELQRSPTD